MTAKQNLRVQSHCEKVKDCVIGCPRPDFGTQWHWKENPLKSTAKLMLYLDLDSNHGNGPAAAVSLFFFLALFMCQKSWHGSLCLKGFNVNTWNYRQED